jgi:CRP-like cAMP-binding protein
MLFFRGRSETGSAETMTRDGDFAPSGKPKGPMSRDRRVGFSSASAASSAAPSNQGLLSGLPEPLLGKLFEAAKAVLLGSDEVLFLAGDAGDGCHRVGDGLLKVTMVSRSGSERILAFLGPGHIVGELSIIDGLPRSASVVAVRLTSLSFLSRAAFEEFARKHPKFTSRW